MKKNFKIFKEFILDLIFPKNCIICGKDDTFFCQKCQKEIEINAWQVCPICEKAITPDGRICNICRELNPPIDQLIVSADYQKSEIARIIHYYKYRFVSELSQPLGKIMLTALIKNNSLTPDFIIPVPLHPYRLRWRGFNQSELLANYLSQNLLPGIEIPVLNNLIQRKKNTPPQMKIKKYADRQKNLAEAFALNKNISSPSSPFRKERIKEGFSFKDKNISSLLSPFEKGRIEKGFNLKNYSPPLIKEKEGVGLISREAFRNKKFLIVDDVCTTGTTIFQCAKILRKLNPAKISAVVLGRQK